MGKLNLKQKRELAETLFIEYGLTAKAIAEQLSITEKTVGNWRKGKRGEKDWSYRRAQNLATPHKIREILLQQLLKVANGETPDVDADALAKISKVLELQSGKTSVQVTLSVLKEFDNWMTEQDPQLSVHFLKWHKQFIIYKASIE